MNKNFRNSSFRKWIKKTNKNTLIMGILNITPDSFSDGGKYLNKKKALIHATNLINSGADIIDIGGESSRPGALPITIDEEKNRVIPIISDLRKENPEILISVDTCKSEVAKEAMEVGADIINDISGMKNDIKMSNVIQENKIPIVIMHMKGLPTNMQKNISYNNLLEDILFFFKERLEYAKLHNIQEDQIILDPGIGFGKTLEQNFILLNNIDLFCSLGYPVLIGTSRKSFLGKTLGLDADNILEGSIASNLFATMKGARILRVHDVKEIKKSLIIFEKAMNSK
ncbi:MAG: dihydropteroate synthase [Candidatus Neomarinimicrobiota bacterium]